MKNHKSFILIAVIFSAVFFYHIENVFALEEYSLKDLYILALKQAEKIKISEEDLFIADRSKDKAFSAFLPVVTVFGEYKKYSEEKKATSSFGSFSIQPRSSSSWGLRIDQSFSLGGKEITNYNISKRNIESNARYLNAVKEEYLFEVASAYYDYLRSLKYLDITKANVERLKKHLDAAKARLHAGEVTKTVVLRAEAELSGAESEKIKAENSLKIAKAILARQVGISEDFLVKEDFEENNNLINLTFSDFQNMALSERAELIASDIQKKIAEERVKYAKGSFFPTVSFEGMYLNLDENPSSPFINDESVYGLLRLNFPVFEGGLRRAEVREAEAKKRQAILSYDDLKKTISIEVENAYLDMHTQFSILKSLQDQTIFAKDNFNAVTKQFAYGLANSIDVMDANTLLVTSERQLSEAKYNYQLSVIKLKRAAGILLKEVLTYK